MAGDKHGKNVVLMAYSEFGRRVAANASQGTDHGTAGPVFVAGAPVKGGFYGDEPSLTDLDNGDLKATTDFRDVYYELLATDAANRPHAVGRHGPTESGISRLAKGANAARSVDLGRSLGGGPALADHDLTAEQDLTVIPDANG